MSPKVALLIDAENISYTLLPDILKEVPRYGQLVLRAIYGDWQSAHLQKWHELAEIHKFKIRHHTNGTKSKNSADIKLMMDALQVLYTTPIEVFCLVSNDADYIPLCEQIREAKKSIIGIGYKHASEAFIRACDKFIFIGRGDSPDQSLVPLPVEAPIPLLKQPSPEPILLAAPPIKVEASIPVPSQPAPLESTNPTLVWELLLKAFAKAPKDANRWVLLAALGEALRQVQPNFQPSHYGHPRITQWLSTMPDLIELKENFVRLKQHIPAKQPKTLEIQKLLAEAFANAEKDANQWVILTKIGQALSKIKPGFKTNSYGHSTLTKLLQSMPEFVELRGKGGDVSARLKK